MWHDCAEIFFCIDGDFIATRKIELAKRRKLRQMLKKSDIRNIGTVEEKERRDWRGKIVVAAQVLETMVGYFVASGEIEGFQRSWSETAQMLKPNISDLVAMRKIQQGKRFETVWEMLQSDVGDLAAAFEIEEGERREMFGNLR